MVGNGTLATATVPTEPDADIEQLAEFLRTLALAVRLDVPIAVVLPGEPR